MSNPRFFKVDDGPVWVQHTCAVCGGDHDHSNDDHEFEGQSFELLDLKWGSPEQGTSGGTVTWSIATQNFGGEPSEFTLPMPDFFMDEVRAAFDAWEAVADIDFVEVADGANVDIRVGLGELDGPLSGSGGGTVGTAFYSFSGGTFIQAHVVLDAADYNSVGDQSEFFLTTLHEIGHAIGLDHEDDVPAIMSTFVNDALTGLTADDIAGARDIYGASATATDDFAPDNTNTNGFVAADGSVNGDIEFTSDEDWFAVTLVEGNQYQFDLTAGTLDDPFLVLRDSNGNLVDQNDDGGSNRDAQISYTATASGTFYLVVSETGTGTGTYTLAAQDLGAPSQTVPGISVSEGTSDAPGNSSTTDSLISGDTFNGTLSSTADIDWIAIDLTAGTEYTFDLQGAGDGVGSLEDGFLVLRNASGGFVAQDDNSGAGLDARIVHTPSTSGTFYISARTFGTDGGTYSLVTSPNERTEDDGTGSGGDGGDGGDSGGDGGTGGGGTIVPGITVSETSDAPASTSTSYSLISGDTFEGELDTGSDRDWIAIDLTVGVEYTFNLQGADSGAGTLDDPFLVLRDANGGFVAQNDDVDFPSTLESQIVFTPSSSGTYYLVARNFSGETGTYVLTTSPGERTDDDGDGGTATPPPDTGGTTVSEGADAAGDTSTSAQISVGDTFEGEIDTVGDKDFVAIDLDAGTQYTFWVQGADSDGGTLADPFLILRDANGTFVSQDDNSGTGLDSQITFTPSSSGTYYLSVRNFTGETGTYSLTAATGSAQQAAQGIASGSRMTGPGEGYVSAAAGERNDCHLRRDWLGVAL